MGLDRGLNYNPYVTPSWATITPRKPKKVKVREFDKPTAAEKRRIEREQKQNQIRQRTSSSGREQPLTTQDKRSVNAQIAANEKRQFYTDAAKRSSTKDASELLRKHTFLEANKIIKTRESRDRRERELRSRLAKEGKTGAEALGPLRAAGFVPGGKDMDYWARTNPIARGIGQFIGEAGLDVAMFAPSMYKLTKDVVSDVKDVASGDVDFSRTAGNVKGIVHGLTHPQTPYQFTMTGLTLAGLGAGAGARVAGAIKAPNMVAAAKALVKRPLAEDIFRPRVHGATYSRSPLMSSVQRVTDPITYGGKGKVSKRLSDRRKGMELQVENRLVTDIAQAEPAQILRAGRRFHGLNTPQQVAVRIVLEGGDPDARLALVNRTISEAAESGNAKAVELAQKEKRVLERTKQYIVNGEINPAAPKAAKLQAIVDRGRTISAEGDKVLSDLGIMDEAALQQRRVIPQLVERGYTYDPPSDSWLTPDGAPLTPENMPTDLREAVYVDPKPPRTWAQKALGKSAGPTRLPPDTNLGNYIPGFNNRYTGASMKTGRYQHKTTQALAKQGLERGRLKEAARIHGELVNYGVPVKPEGKYVPIYTRRLKPGETAAVQRAINNIDGESMYGFTPDDVLRGATSMEDAAKLEAYAKLDAGAEIPGVVWVPKSTVWRIGTNPEIVKGLGKLNREASSAFRGAILYLNGLGYVVPNAVDNAARLLIQQGPHLAVTVPKYAKWALSGELKKVAPYLDALASEGKIVASFGERAAQGPISAPVQATAQALGWLSDTHFRRVAVMREAAVKGFTTPDDIIRLATSPKHKAAAKAVRNRSNDALLDFSRMNPFEREFLNRWLFLYAFFKAGVRYGVRFPGEHPVLTGAASTMGEETKQELDKQLSGKRPSYAQQIVPTGTTNVEGVGEVPTVRNLEPVNQLSPMHDVAMTLANEFGLAEGGNDFRIVDFINPTLRVLASGVTGFDMYTGRKVEGNILDRFAAGAGEQIPLLRDLEVMFGDNEGIESRVYPEQGLQRARKYLEGSIRERPYNPDAAAAAVAKETKVSPAKREYRNTFKERKAVLEGFKKKAPQVLVNGRLPKPLRDAYNKQASVNAVRARMDKAYEPGVERERAKFKEEIRLIASWGDSVKPDEAYAWAETASFEDLRDAREWLSNNVFEQAFLRDTRYAEKILDN